MTRKSKSIKRILETHKSEIKVQALHLWKLGHSVTSIAKECSVGRDTVYRWIKNIDRKISQPTKRNRKTVDEISRFRILESYFILKAPSIPHLKRVIEVQYQINLSEPQLRRLLKKWNVSDYRPSSLHDSLIRYQFETEVSLRASRDKEHVAESADRSAERSLRREPLNPPSVKEGIYEEAIAP